jgi:AmmeMemoRadiSam system protein B
MEHSIEFQAVMLAYLFGPRVKIVPILCSMFSEDLDPPRPAELLPVRRFLDACRQLAASRPAVSVVAGADLAHVGPRFGDPFDVDDDLIRRVAGRDREDLAEVTRMAPDAFYASVMKDGNERKVCGLGCIYAALKTVDGCASGGDVLHYDYAHDPAGGIVSFASIQLS